MDANTTETLDIQGTQFDFTAACERMALFAACIGLGVFLWPLRKHTFWGLDSPDAVSGAWTVAAIPWLIAAILPYKSHTFLDFVSGQMVTLKYYGWFRISNHQRLLTDFGHIVVRHVCHPGGEGPDTFTGSVGLKPKDGRAVFWLKDFTSTQDEVPREAYAFAKTLQARLPLPVAIPWIERLELEETTPSVRCNAAQGHATYSTREAGVPDAAPGSDVAVSPLASSEVRPGGGPRSRNLGVPECPGAGSSAK